MRFIIILSFIFLMSSFNFSNVSKMNMEMNTTSLVTMEHSDDCHEEIVLTNENFCDNSMSCDSDCANTCSTSCTQTSSFIITKFNNNQVNPLKNVKLETLSQAYKSMPLSNLFRPPIA